MGYDDKALRLFRDAVRRERVAEHRDWTQAELAERMREHGAPDTTWAMVNKIENGSRNVTIGEAAAIADAFGVTIDRLCARRARPASDRDFVLGQLFEVTADGQRTVRVAVRDITERLSDVGDVDPDGTLADLVIKVHKACEKLTEGGALLAACGGDIAGLRGHHRRVLRVQWEEDDDA